MVSSGSVRTVLVVDDEQIVRDMCATMLESLGFASLAARDGQEAVDLFARHHDVVTAVVLDLTMPVMNGEEAFRALRGLRADLPVLIASGSCTPEVAARLGVDRRLAYLKKPYVAADLSRALRALLEA